MKIENIFSSLKNYTTPLVSFVLIVVLIPSVIIPQLNKIVDSSSIINANADRLDSLEEKADTLEGLAASRALLDSQLANAEKILPITKAIAPLVLGVQQIAIKNDLKVEAIRLAPGKVATTSASKATENAETSNQLQPTLSTNRSEVVFEMRLIGSLTSLRNFLEVVERGRRLIVLKSIKSSRLSNSSYSASVFFGAPYSLLPELKADQIAASLPQVTASDQEFLNRLISTEFRDVTTTDINSGQTGTSNPFD